MFYVLFLAQQNVAFRRHEEDWQNIGDASLKNRGNFLELLSLRCSDIDWLEEKLKVGIGKNKYTSPDIQNEIIEIIASLIFKRITGKI